MTVHERAAETYKMLNYAGCSHDECLREAVDSATAPLRNALNRQSDNMAFLINHAMMPQDFYEKFKCELEEDRAALSDGGQKND